MFLRHFHGVDKTAIGATSTRLPECVPRQLSVAAAQASTWASRAPLWRACARPT